MMETVSKGEFAAIIGVTPGRVSQYLKEGRISRAAIDGEGRSARIHVEQAKADLRIMLDIGQRFGNGIGTRLDPTPQPHSKRPANDVPLASGIDQEIKEQKLEQIRRQNRQAALAEAASRGVFMKADDARAQLAKIATDMVVTFEGSLPEMANAIAAEFKVPRRDTLHLLRRTFNQVRRERAKQFSDVLATLPEVVTEEINFESQLLEVDDVKRSDN